MLFVIFFYAIHSSFLGLALRLECCCCIIGNDYFLLLVVEADPPVHKESVYMNRAKEIYAKRQGRILRLSIPWFSHLWWTGNFTDTLARG